MIRHSSVDPVKPPHFSGQRKVINVDTATFVEQSVWAVKQIKSITTNPLKLTHHKINDNEFIGCVPILALWRIFDMATKKKPASKSTWQQIEFINYKMDKDTKAKFKRWLETPVEARMALVHETLQSDHKFSISWDVNNECFIASLTGKAESLNPNKCISLRAHEWDIALFAVTFVHVVVFSGEIWDVEEAADIL